MKPKLPAGQPLPPVFKHRYTFEWFRKLTWRERIAILMGANFCVMVQFWTANSAGAVQPDFIGGTTLAKTPRQQAEYSAAAEARLAARLSAAESHQQPDKPWPRGT